MMTLLFYILLIFSHNNDDIKEFFLSKHSNSEIEVLSIKIPEGIYNITVSREKEIRYNGNSALIQIKGIKNNKQLNSYAELKYREFSNVLIAQSDIKNRMSLNKEMFHEERIDVSNFKRRVFSEKQLFSLRSKQYLKKGSILFLDQVELLPCIKDGNSIKLFYNGGNILLETSGLAKKDGSINEIIPVITGDKKIYKAKIIDSTRAEIIP